MSKMEKEQKNIRDAIYKHFAEDQRFGNMFMAGIITKLLPDFVENTEEYSDDEKKENKKLVDLFKKSTTSFGGFFVNRKNVFSNKAISTSVCYRIVNDNALTFFNNMRVFKRIKDKLDEQEFKNLEKDTIGNDQKIKLTEIFSPGGYKDFLTQEGITLHNDICGKVNSFMNKYCQSRNENKNYYKMKKLHKQILCIPKNSYESIHKFQSDEEVYQAVNDFLENFNQKELSARLIKISDNIKLYDLNKIYIVKNYFGSISKKIYGDWSVITLCLEKYYSNKLRGKKETKAERVEKQVKKVTYQSIGAINKLVADYELCQDENVKVEDYICEIVNIIGNNDFRPLTCDSGVSLIEDKDKASEIKNTLDVIMNIYHWCKAFIMEDLFDKDIAFYNELEEIYDEISPIYTLYNLVRNYVTQKPYSIEKIKLNFGNKNLVEGWSNEYKNNAVILIRDGLLYLGLFNKKNKPDKLLMRGKQTEDLRDYKKMIYMQWARPKLDLPRLFLKNKNYDKEKIDKKSSKFDIIYTRKLIDYYKMCISEHPSWKEFKFKFSETSSYEDINEFCKEIEEQGYKIDWTYISEENINKMQEEKQLFLFQIYNKDFSDKSSGSKNLHTMYLQNLFSPENLKDVVLKLNGKAEIFYRVSSIKQPVIHRRGSVLVNRTYEVIENDRKVRKTLPEEIYTEIYNKLNGYSNASLSKEAQDFCDKGLIESHVATIDIIKDNRYTVDKYFLHLPITINFKANTVNINEQMHKYIASAKDIHVIGIDRGERNLVYVSVVDTKGRIVEQKSFNIVNGYDYQDKLRKRGNDIQSARKDWKEIEKIKDLKEGYLSTVVHEIVKMVIQYNGIIVMEDLNYGFKTSRFKVDRQVYQKFETMLIKKLNYLVFKDRQVNEKGGVLKGYQLTYIPVSFKNVGSQCGCIFYVPAAYTSKIDPTTGFANIFRFKNMTAEKKREFINKFDSIKYDASEDKFEFAFDYNKYDTQNVPMPKTKWKVYTYGERVKKQFKNGRCTSKSERSDINSKIKKVFEGTDVSWKDGNDLREEIINYNLTDKVIDIFKLTVQLRNSLSESDNQEYDKIVSPVKNSEGYFYDSDNADDSLPKDADANGAYCIALKGLLEVNRIKDKHNWDDEVFKTKNLKITFNDWFDFIQNKRFL